MKSNEGIENSSNSSMKEDIEYMKKCLCKIYIKDIISGAGFFTKIPYLSQILPVLVTTNHVIKNSDIINNEKIKILVYDKKDFEYIKIDDSKLIFTDDKLDITIIEIQENKEKKYNFLDIDDKMNKDRLKVNKSIYILNYPKINTINKSNGILSEITDKYLFHSCKIEENSLGSPILASDNNKVIGINCENSNYDFNKGLSIKYSINELNKLNQMTIKYNVTKDDYKIKIFGKKFVERNKKNCKIMIEDIETDIREYIYITENMRVKRMVEIKLKEKRKITDMSYMFSDDNNYNISFGSLSLLTDFSEWNTKNVTDMSFMFYNLSSILHLPGISKWDTSNVTNMSYMFSNCKSLKELPDISKWNTNMVTNLKGIFSHCESLEKLPDISKWEFKNVIDISNMFDDCGALKELPDISKWRTEKIIKMKSLFYGCSSLMTLPDISKWDIKNVNDISYLFSNCKSLAYNTLFISLLFLEINYI